MSHMTKLNMNWAEQPLNTSLPGSRGRDWIFLNNNPSYSKYKVSLLPWSWSHFCLGHEQPRDGQCCPGNTGPLKLPPLHCLGLLGEPRMQHGAAATPLHLRSLRLTRLLWLRKGRASWVLCGVKESSVQWWKELGLCCQRTMGWILVHLNWNSACHLTSMAMENTITRS